MASLLLSKKVTFLLYATVGLGSANYILEKALSKAYLSPIQSDYVQIGTLVGFGLIGLRFLLKKQKRIAEERKVFLEEEQGAKESNDKLLSSPYYDDLIALKKQLDGEIILPDEGEKYHKCRRRAFNLNQRGYPVAIARVKNAQDVAKCVKFAEKNQKNLSVCVASGCHSSKCMMTGNFVIDMVYMNEAKLDLNAMTVKVEGGAYLEEVDKVLEPHNLGVTVGTYPETGVGGLTLGGGFGHLGRMFGFSVDNLLECEVVLPTGEIVVANDNNQYSDLIWGLRGGGGNFGVVTKFTFKVHKLPTHCLGGPIINFAPTASSAITVVTNYDKLITECPNNVMAMLVLPAGAPVVPTMWSHFGEITHPSQSPHLTRASKLGGWFVMQNDVKQCSYHKDLQRMTTAIITSGHIYHTLIQFGKTGEDLSPVLIENVVKFAKKSPHPTLRDASIVFFNMGGVLATNDADGSRTSISPSIRKAKYFAIIEVYWKPECGQEGFEQARAWARGMTDIIKPFCNESLRYAAADAKVDPLQKDQPGFGETVYNKLRTVKAKYDPYNLFKNNMNVTPSTQQDKAVKV